MTVNPSQVFVLQNAATVNGNGQPASVDGYGNTQQVEIAETNGGTCTVALQGTFDGINWITGVGYQLVSNTASPARAVANISVTASTRNVYQILDPYQQIRAVISAIAGSAIVTIRCYAQGAF